MIRPRIWFGVACRLWLCQDLTAADGIYGAGDTPQEAYADWLANRV
jgi:hypothetical protein